MLLEHGDFNHSDIKPPSNQKVREIREAGQNLINARLFAENVKTSDSEGLDFAINNLASRLNKLTKLLSNNCWLIGVPNEIFLGYIDEIPNDYSKGLNFRMGLYYITDKNPDLNWLRMYPHKKYGFFGEKVLKPDARIRLNCANDDWLKTDKVDVYLFNAIPQDRREEVLLPWNIPEHVKTKLAL